MPGTDLTQGGGGPGSYEACGGEGSDRRGRWICMCATRTGKEMMGLISMAAGEDQRDRERRYIRPVIFFQQKDVEVGIDPSYISTHKWSEDL